MLLRMKNEWILYGIYTDYLLMRESFEPILYQSHHPAIQTGIDTVYTGSIALYIRRYIY